MIGGGGEVVDTNRQVNTIENNSKGDRFRESRRDLMEKGTKGNTLDDSNLSQVYEDTPPSSLDVSVTGEVEYDHGGVTAGEMSDRLQRDDCLLEMGVQDRRCMTNMVMWNTDVQNGMDGQIRG
jgi:hypothetical protein